MNVLRQLVSHRIYRKSLPNFTANHYQILIAATIVFRLFALIMGVMLIAPIAIFTAWSCEVTKYVVSVPVSSIPLAVNHAKKAT